MEGSGDASSLPSKICCCCTGAGVVARVMKAPRVPAPGKINPANKLHAHTDSPGQAVQHDILSFAVLLRF